uniref:Uncharacterized protein n=1 Tax=Ciona intestinalis TaxID=7719 RepID=F6ZCS4_CIOIN
IGRLVVRGLISLLLRGFLARSMTSESEPPQKKMCLNGEKVKIGTHNGTFHCDEVLACYLLKLLPKYKDAEIVRTRDTEILNNCDIVVDVGGVYDHDKNRYDHHQRSFSGTMNSIRPDKPWKTKLSSAGLVYCHYGEEILKLLLGEEGSDEKIVSVIYDKVYEKFVHEIDAIDNGVDQFDGEARYHISTNISSRVGHLNPSWNEKRKNENKSFEVAMAMVGKEFEDRIHGYVTSWLPARDIVVKAIKQRHQISDQGQILLLDQYCPWKEHLFTLEDEEFVPNGEIKYVLYEDNAQKWRIQCVPAGRNTFENRLSILAEWRGLRDEELSKLSGIPGCVFVHASGFIGGNATRDGVLQMAMKCLEGNMENTPLPPITIK